LPPISLKREENAALGDVPGAVEPVLRAEHPFPGFAILIRADFEDSRGDPRLAQRQQEEESCQARKY